MEKVKLIIDEFDDENVIVYVEKAGKNLWKVLSLYDFEEEMDYWEITTQSRNINGKRGFIFSKKIDMELLKSEIYRFVYDHKLDQKDFDL
ncbi:MULTISPECIES: hypothetical protein [Clostridium]|uniref:Uncharacterized protein n=1 Tax=Clostridium frigoriphilum TaxID=443253 RepID=A0ABU7UVI2_9CLOT|nr:hypothetical protein [Clostridium sp. DSM 17811]MBU3102412.1 hypothetical protein [Clostridium sp. DSM 17811]